MRSAACTNSYPYRAHTGALGSCWGRGGLGGPLTGPAVKGGGYLSRSNQLSTCLGITVPRESFICSPTQSLTHQFIHSFISYLLGTYLDQGTGGWTRNQTKTNLGLSLEGSLPGQKNIPQTNRKSQQRHVLGRETSQV